MRDVHCWIISALEPLARPVCLPFLVLICVQVSGVLMDRCTVEPPEKEVVDVLQFQDEISNQTSLPDVPGECALNTTTVDIVCGEGV